MIFSVTRRIGIDAGHRIMTHGSKCRHLHGHRYTIEATAEARALQPTGEQTDMVLDFSFLRDEMVAEIDTPCDHGFIASTDDEELLGLFAPDPASAKDWIAALRQTVARAGHASTHGGRLGTKLYLIKAQPTAECLARHWFSRLAPRVAARSEGLARLTAVTVWETPNCRADYRPE